MGSPSVKNLQLTCSIFDQIMDILSQPPSTPVYTPRKRKALTLEDRVGVIQMAEAGQSARGIAAMYDVGKTQVQVSNAL